MGLTWGTAGLALVLVLGTTSFLQDAEIPTAERGLTSAELATLAELTARFERGGEGGDTLGSYTLVRTGDDRWVVRDAMREVPDRDPLMDLPGWQEYVFVRDVPGRDPVTGFFDPEGSAVPWRELNCPATSADLAAFAARLDADLEAALRLAGATDEEIVMAMEDIRAGCDALETWSSVLCREEKLALLLGLAEAAR